MILIDRQLAAREKQTIWNVIYSNWAPDDRDPAEVIIDRYAGDENAYLTAMARWHRIWPFGGVLESRQTGEC